MIYSIGCVKLLTIFRLIDFFSCIANNDHNSKKYEHYKWKIFLFINKVLGLLQNLKLKSVVAIVELCTNTTSICFSIL